MRMLAAGCLFALLAGGCGDPDNLLEGSLGSQYDLSFDSTRAKQYQQSNQLAIEYVRGETGAEEKPIIITVNPTPEGPGTFTLDDDVAQVGIDSSLLPGEPDLPELTSATLDLDAFTPLEEGSRVQGTLHSMFTNEGMGDSFSLKACFKTTLTIVY